jgi:signal transduction histidine kinase
VEISLGPVERDGDLYVVATVSDISERKRRQRELRRQNERLERFASIVSHDLRNPLNVAEARLELAREDEDEDEHLDAIERSLDRMSALIEGLLTLARKGDVVEEIQLVDLQAVVEDCWRNVETANATLVVETERKIRADRERLQQLLENLLGNAIEHGGDGVTLTVGALEDGFYVEDDGRGIPAEDRQHIFQRGYSTSRDGTGFGLAIVNEIVEAHDWRISVVGGEPCGTRFEITGVEGP